MFRKVRRQLTIFNSILMGVFLLVFIIIAFAGSIWGVYAEEQKDILGYAREEAEENLDLLKDKTYSQPGFLKEETGENELMLFYVFDNQGRLIRYSNPHPGLDRLIIREIKAGGIRYGKPDVATWKLPRERHHLRELLAVFPIRDGATVYGKIYVGKNVTDLYHLFQKLLYIMVLITILFLFLLTILGFIMAGRSMAPIKLSYEKQREFLADASHELRTPLSVLLASVESIQGDEANRMTDFTGQVLGDMKDEIKKMTRIVNDLLTLARSDAAVLNLLKEQFDLKTVAEKMVRTIKPLAQAKNIDLQITFPEQITVYADRERIAQLLLILVDNAVKYTPNGGQVQLAIRRPEDSGGSGVEIVVQDNGIGIAAEEQDLIFGRFYRTDKARSRTMGGSGLGLPIAKWIVEQHGGSITVSSKPGDGARFVAVMPL
jgi:two-component system sensor histidine kinase CiaH